MSPTKALNSDHISRCAPSMSVNNAVNADPKLYMVKQQPPFDATKFKQAQGEQWNQDGEAWRYWTPTLDLWYGEASRQMLNLARIQPGHHVLDIAAGAGEPAVSAAERVGPGGYVLATDISEGILELARQVAHERGLKQVETRPMDGEELDLPDASFDAVLCRLGLMYMPHPVTALREWRRVLKVGGWVAVAVFSSPIAMPGVRCPLPSSAGAHNSRPPFRGNPDPLALAAPACLKAYSVRPALPTLSFASFRCRIERPVPPSTCGSREKPSVGSRP